MADNINMHSFNDNTIMGFTINFILVVSINTFTGWLSLVSIVLLILFNYKNIRKQIIEEGGFWKWLKNFTNLKK